MSFKSFVTWTQTRQIKTLGCRRKVIISTSGSQVICENSNKKIYLITKSKFNQTLKQYNKLRGQGKHTSTSQYTDTHWKACPDRVLCPYIAAAIAYVKKEHPCYKNES